MALVVKNQPANAGDVKKCRFDAWNRKIPWSSKWQPAPVFLPWKSDGQRSLADYSLWGCKELDMTEPACACVCGPTHTHTHTHTHTEDCVFFEYPMRALIFLNHWVIMSW